MVEHECPECGHEFDCEDNEEELPEFCGKEVIESPLFQKWLQGGNGCILSGNGFILRDKEHPMMEHKFSISKFPTSETTNETEQIIYRITTRNGKRIGEYQPLDKFDWDNAFAYSPDKFEVVKRF